MHAKPSFESRQLAGEQPVPAGRTGAAAFAGTPGNDAAPARWRIPRVPDAVWRHAVWVGVLVIVAYAIDRLDIDLGRLPGLLGRMGSTLASRYFPPNLAHIAQPDYLHAVFETLEMSYLAAVVGLVLAVPFAWLASANATPSRRIGYPLARLVIMTCRSVHEMIWTILLVAVLGFGMLPGAIALTLYCVGFAGKLFAEAAEAVDPGPLDAMRAMGANPAQVFVFAVLPQVRVAWTGTSIYAWDVVFRAATVVGFFGAGGMGWYLRESVQRIASQDVAAILLSIIVVVLAAELLSAWIRARVSQAIA